MGKPAAVLNMNGTSVEPPAKKQRERICLIETMPKPEWVVKTTNERGRTVWYLRMEITGLLPRRFGPFKSRHTAMLVLDKMLDILLESVCDIERHAQDRMLQGPYQYRMECCVLEDDLGQAYRHPNGKKNGRSVTHGTTR